MIARSIAGFAVLLLLCGSASAQADLEEEYQEKLEKEVYMLTAQLKEAQQESGAGGIAHRHGQSTIRIRARAGRERE